jgi:hypothetical protein
MITPDSSERFSRRISEAAYRNGEVRFHDLTTFENEIANPREVELGFPERVLAVGVLRQATADLRRFRDSKDAIGREMYADAYSWFAAIDSEWPYSFYNVCRVLGLSAAAVLDEVFVDPTCCSRSRRITRSMAQSVKFFLSGLFTCRHRQSFAKS